MSPTPVSSRRRASVSPVRRSRSKRTSGHVSRKTGGRSIVEKSRPPKDHW